MPKQEFSFLTPHYNIDYNGWHIDGTIMEWIIAFLIEAVIQLHG